MEQISGKSMDMFEHTYRKIKNKDVILIGEIHGTREIPLLLEKYFDLMSNVYSFDIALEIPKNNQEVINKFLEDKDDSLLKKTPFFLQSLPTDGRNSAAYFHLIKSIFHINNYNDKKIKIFCIDVHTEENIKDQNDRERKMAENIFEKITVGKKIFVVLGNLHASKKKCKFDDNAILPVGYLLSKKVDNKIFSIDIRPLKGRFYNFTIKEIDNNASDYNKKYFDYIYNIQQVSPCSFLK